MFQVVSPCRINMILIPVLPLAVNQLNIQNAFYAAQLQHDVVRDIVANGNCHDVGVGFSSAANLHAVDIGWEGVLAGDIAKRYPTEFALWHTQPEKVQMPDGGESLEDVRRRARAAFDEYAAQYEGKTVLVAAHDAVNKAIICDLLGLDMSHFWQIKQDNTCVNVLEYTGGTWRVVLLNSTQHLGFLFSGIEQAGL